MKNELENLELTGTVSNKIHFMGLGTDSTGKLDPLEMLSLLILWTGM